MSTLITSGQSGESLMGFILSAGKIVLIISVATVFGAGGGRLFQDLTEGISSSMMYVINGSNGDDPYKEIDKNLTLMQAGLGGMRSLDTGGNQEVADQKNQAIMMSAAGTAGPAIVAGTMLLINKFAWALFIGFAPIFILCLLFEPTKSMFTKWLNFGIGISVSLAVLTFMTAIAMKMVLAMTGATFAASFLTSSTGGFTQAAMQQGGLGLVLTALLVTVPSMASNFVGGFTSGFSLNSAFGQSGSYGHGGGHGGGGSSGGGTVTAPNTRTSDTAPDNNTTPTHGSRFTMPASSTGSSSNYQDVIRPAGTSTMGLARGAGPSSLGLSAGAAGIANSGYGASSNDTSGNTTSVNGASTAGVSNTSDYGALPQGRQNPARI